MEQIAKCPHCGESAYARILADDFGYHHCGVSCDTAKLWNQYAAAMEYAKKTAYWFLLLGCVDRQEDALAEQAMQDAERRVIEVFNE